MTRLTSRIGGLIVSWEACLLFLNGNEKPFPYESQFTCLRSLYPDFEETGNHANSPRNKLSDSDKGDRLEI